jgi:hypothetical protein
VITRTSLFALVVLVLVLFARLLRRAFSRSWTLAGQVKATLLPSGDQAGAPAPCGTSLIARPSPPWAPMRWICGGSRLPSFRPARRNAMVFPSGDQRGALSRGPDVNARAGWLPSAGTIQIACRSPSFWASTVTRTNATCMPSGDTRGSATTRSGRSVSVMGRLDAAAPGGPG